MKIRNSLIGGLALLMTLSTQSFANDVEFKKMPTEKLIEMIAEGRIPQKEKGNTGRAAHVSDIDKVAYELESRNLTQRDQEKLIEAVQLHIKDYKTVGIGLGDLLLGLESKDATKVVKQISSQGKFREVFFSGYDSSEINFEAKRAKKLAIGLETFGPKKRLLPSLMKDGKDLEKLLEASIKKKVPLSAYSLGLVADFCWRNASRDLEKLCRGQVAALLTAMTQTGNKSEKQVAIKSLDKISRMPSDSETYASQPWRAAFDRDPDNECDIEGEVGEKLCKQVGMQVGVALMRQFYFPVASLNERLAKRGLKKSTRVQKALNEIHDLGVVIGNYGTIRGLTPKYSATGAMSATPSKIKVEKD